MKKSALILCVLLPGCASVENALRPQYVPQPIHVYNEIQYNTDVAECTGFAYGTRYSPDVSAGTLAADTFGGATSNSSLWAVAPTAPAFGAGGALVGGLADGYFGIGTSRYSVAENCLHDELEIDHAAVVARPHK